VQTVSSPARLHSFVCQRLHVCLHIRRPIKTGVKSVDYDVIAIKVSIILVGMVSVNRSKYNFGSLHTAPILFTYLEDCET
jgi:hypothetical protein